ncbi:MAG: SurA N-terminal domain-containing protein [Proteobacteria bacterium]|nr:SurA N-terminal domain-containing protein [Pseudomonadota bacterium]MBU1397380.1 SurA N-terminal domain-containing protein [Pseudomonadota bacterium]MBU1571164.1 SurA N-terminal domain-containing protein [Pseudomonadota bacterium]
MIYVKVHEHFTAGETCSARIFAVCALFAVLILSGCSGTESVQGDEYLVRVQESVLMVLDFQRELEITKSAYSRNDIEQNASFHRDTKEQLLNQMVEELIIIERSKELNITVTDSELEEAVRKIKRDYPESEFEKMLLEYAISYNLWEKRLRMRLLIEKVIVEDLKNNIQITPDDLSKYYRENIKNGADGKLANEPTTETIIKNLRNLKAEEAYKTWFEGLQRKYKIEINNKQWEKILSS